MSRVLFAIPFLACLLLVAGGHGADPVFEVLKPDQVTFNYPDPPKEGEASFFAIAKGGEAQCVIVIPEKPDKSFRAAVSEFAKYIELSTGAEIKIVEDGNEIPAGLGAIHVGETTRAKSVPLDLPELDYGDGKFLNRRGFLVKTLDPETLLIRGYDNDATNTYHLIKPIHHIPSGDINQFLPARTFPFLSWNGATGPILRVFKCLFVHSESGPTWISIDEMELCPAVKITISGSGRAVGLNRIRNTMLSSMANV